MLGVLTSRHILWILAFSAGFADTATFLGADGIFSAHVTGNFVVFASNFFSTGGDWSKLLTFPFFALGVLFVSFCAGRRILDLRKSLIAIALLVAVSGALALFEVNGQTGVFLVVVAMGLQNGAHKLYLKGTPTSTVMTGNVTQVFLDLFSPKTVLYFQTVELIICFFFGCLAGAFLTARAGLSSLFLPAVLFALAPALRKDGA